MTSSVQKLKVNYCNRMLVSDERHGTSDIVYDINDINDFIGLAPATLIMIRV